MRDGKRSSDRRMEERQERLKGGRVQQKEGAREKEGEMRTELSPHFITAWFTSVSWSTYCARRCLSITARTSPHRE